MPPPSPPRHMVRRGHWLLGPSYRLPLPLLAADNSKSKLPPPEKLPPPPDKLPPP